MYIISLWFSYAVYIIFILSVFRSVRMLTVYVIVLMCLASFSNTMVKRSFKYWISLYCSVV